MDTPNVSPGKAPGFANNPDKLLEFEPSPRRIRVKVNGEIIVDSTNVMLMREGGHVPVLYFPMDDVRMELFSSTDHTSNCGYKGDASYWTLTLGDRIEENVMWSYRDPYDETRIIKDYVAFYWDRMDEWWEEDEQIFGHARDPKKRLDTVPSHRPVKVMLGGAVVAETTDAIFAFETNHPQRFYIPQNDVRMELLTQTETQSVCPYKGSASYYSATIDGRQFEDIAWSYQDTLPECPRIKDLICFFNENVDAIYLDGKELPRPDTKWSK
ncbi:MAG: hypothetical protein CMM52_07225 [Rhodospirillaceae bacterium]|mgnify:CR=1 FL=1|nr:hypothetical protein [Rhodospirillaceae bacterium]|tara:strand:- start:25791 stop:26597 length:807 start_codon:yes stop_codon:yes gene_type:complete